MISFTTLADNFCGHGVFFLWIFLLYMLYGSMGVDSNRESFPTHFVAFYTPLPRHWGSKK